MAQHARRILVTGAARGLGRSIAEQLTVQGDEVWAADLLPAPKDLKAAHNVELDVTDAAAVRDLIGLIHREGGIDGLVNNAAVFPLCEWDKLELAQWQRTLDVNLTAPFVACQAAGVAMREQGRGGAIVNISSLTFFKGQASAVAYASSKGGVIGLTRCFAKALGPYRIRVNSVAPGLMATEGVLEQVHRGYLDPSQVEPSDPHRQLPGRTHPDGVAEAVLYLLSDQAREVTGQVLAADGGTIFL